MSEPSYESSDDYKRLVMAHDDPNFEQMLRYRISEIIQKGHYDINEDELEYVRQAIVEELAADYKIYDIGELTVEEEAKLPEGVNTIDFVVEDELSNAGFGSLDDEYDWEHDADHDRWGI